MTKLRILYFAVALIVSLSATAFAQEAVPHELDPGIWSTVNGMCTYDLLYNWNGSWAAGGADLAVIGDARPPVGTDPRVRQNIINQTGDSWTDWHVEIINGKNLRDITVRKAAPVTYTWIVQVAPVGVGFFAHIEHSTGDPNNPEAIHTGDKLYVDFTYDVLNLEQIVSVIQYPTTGYAIPEPSSLLALLVGVSGTLGVLRRKG